LPDNSWAHMIYICHSRVTPEFNPKPHALSEMETEIPRHGLRFETPPSIALFEIRNLRSVLVI
jgi:hypothetical protein